MEDRHYLSEPRPIAGLKLPTWEVDIMREGVDTPILTLTVDSKVLPARKRKKKVVWKLPDDLETVPKFGMEDKRRILELFKQKKKELKRKRKSQTVSTTPGGGGGSGSIGKGEEDDDDYDDDEQNSPTSSNSNGNGNAKTLHRMSSSAMSVGSYMTANENEEQPEDDPGEEKVECSGHDRHDHLQQHQQHHHHHRKEEEEKVQDSNHLLLGSAPTPPGFNLSGLSLDDDSPTPHVVRQPRPTPPPPPSMQPLQERAHSFAGSRGPPMSAAASTTTTTTSTPRSTAGVGAVPRPPPPPPGLLNNPSSYSSTATRRASTSSIPPPGMGIGVNNNNNNNNQNHPYPLVSSIGGVSGVSADGRLNYRHFIVADPSALGHVVMETYYMLLRNKMVQDLALYYTPDAQKSLTVGGAHALCTDVNQRLQQLESLTKMVLQVKGVLQHPPSTTTTTTNITYLMITGTTLQPQQLPFCHSLCLKQVGPQAYQIQNDALAFLTTEG